MAQSTCDHLLAAPQSVGSVHLPHWYVPVLPFIRDELDPVTVTLPPSNATPTPPTVVPVLPVTGGVPAIVRVAPSLLPLTWMPPVMPSSVFPETVVSVSGKSALSSQSSPLGVLLTSPLDLSRARIGASLGAETVAGLQARGRDLDVEDALDLVRARRDRAPTKRRHRGEPEAIVR